MPNLKEVRTRIASVKSTQQITAAMKMVAASKLRKAQNAILKMRPYAAKLFKLLQDLSESIENQEENIYAEEREINKVLLIVVTSNKGLCGSFNSNIIKATNDNINNNYKSIHSKGNLHMLCIGKKAADYFTKKEFKNLEKNTAILENLSFRNIVPIADNLMAAFAEKKYDKIEIIYNQFKNAAIQRLIIEQYLPMIQFSEKKDKDKENNDHINYIFEPGKEEIIKEVIPKSLKIQLYKALLDSYTSEQGARMTAMHMATENAQELIKDLQLKYNKARQASITSELLDIISGAESLKR